ncbi:SLOG family protein [Embleya hyalina]|uniref:DNA-binding response regulator n=1 Tax=Embleya hyalina TaxID=516124 RepID=A0A401YHK8_9ACTN|nr:SLOG family protein [Embleya hyalina]GCD94058.1 DNA-binding response regulator [Embleya hyalina]
MGSTPYRILTTGSRHWTDATAIKAAITDTLTEYGPDATVVHGAAPGADTLVDQVARSLGLPTERHPAQWRARGRSAGPIRNQQMVDLGAVVCLAFPLAGSFGTADCMRRATAAGIPVRVAHPGPPPAPAGPGPELTDRQVEVLADAARGLSVDEIAARLGIAPDTVKGHRVHALTALGADSMAHGVALAIAYGHLPADTALTARSTP